MFLNSWLRDGRRKRATQAGLPARSGLMSLTALSFSQARLSLRLSESPRGSAAGAQPHAPVLPGAISSTLSSLPPGSRKA